MLIIFFSIYDFVNFLNENYFEIFNAQDDHSTYHPKPLIMSLLYTYSKGVFSGRKIDGEQIFEQLKAVLSFTRFNLKGESKRKPDVSLVLIANI
jgi:transposase